MLGKLEPLDFTASAWVVCVSSVAGCATSVVYFLWLKAKVGKADFSYLSQREK